MPTEIVMDREAMTLELAPVVMKARAEAVEAKEALAEARDGSCDWR